MAFLKFILSLQSLVCLNGDVIKRETISAMPAGNAKFLMDSVFELSQRINRFKLADAEIGLFSSVVIIAAGKKRFVDWILEIHSLSLQTDQGFGTPRSSVRCRPSWSWCFKIFWPRSTQRTHRASSASLWPSSTTSGASTRCTQRSSCSRPVWAEWGAPHLQPPASSTTFCTGPGGSGRPGTRTGTAPAAGVPSPRTARWPTPTAMRTWGGAPSGRSAAARVSGVGRRSASCQWTTLKCTEWAASCSPPSPPPPWRPPAPPPGRGRGRSPGAAPTTTGPWRHPRAGRSRNVHSRLGNWTLPQTVASTVPRLRGPIVQTPASVPARGPAWRTRWRTWRLRRARPRPPPPWRVQSWLWRSNILSSRELCNNRLSHSTWEECPASRTRSIIRSSGTAAGRTATSQPLHRRVPEGRGRHLQWRAGVSWPVSWPLLPPTAPAPFWPPPSADPSPSPGPRRASRGTSGWPTWYWRGDPSPRPLVRPSPCWCVPLPQHTPHRDTYQYQWLPVSRLPHRQVALTSQHNTITPISRWHCQQPPTPTPPPPPPPPPRTHSL